MDEAMSVFKEFHALSAKDKAIETSKDPNKSCYIYTSSPSYATEKFHFRRDGLMHHSEVSKLGFRILEFISRGLGISSDHFSSGLCENQALVVNHYPPCPDPSLTLGVGKHRDPGGINILLQSVVYGLQVFKDEEWVGVEPIPYAFVVNIGYPL
ncbi:hypothetical protein SO802_023078 [Lithocarpus litseifolius]|uniref:Isopenicillin N synthase-like Fe(2+) 2OG dioxygenase domain-containing protein n=1 Tax=Lithocarpus litseifolius TaxID=425828 RepID=A0AAW2CAP8_9ROSI